MTTSFLSREQQLNSIIAMEERMFVAVKASSPSACQEHLHTFRTMRRMAHSVLSSETLSSYAQDLREASMPRKKEGCCRVPCLPEFAEADACEPLRNFFTEKYARIEEKIPVLNNNPVIDEIVAIESAWFHELRSRFPRLLQGNGSFERYEHAELETYSDRTLALYARDIHAGLSEGRNLVEERYRFLYKALNLGEMEDYKDAPETEPQGEINVR